MVKITLGLYVKINEHMDRGFFKDNRLVDRRTF
jgi:hypothetical protein